MQKLKSKKKKGVSVKCSFQKLPQQNASEQESPQGTFFSPYSHGPMAGQRKNSWSGRIVWPSESPETKTPLGH